MKDIQPWIEVIIFLAGWIAVIAAQKQQAKDQQKTIDAMGKKIDWMGTRIDAVAASVGLLGNHSTLHEEQISTLRRAVDQQDRDNGILFDEVKGTLVRHGRQINKSEKWIVAADQTLRRLEPGWQPPLNGD